MGLDSLWAGAIGHESVPPGAPWASGFRWAGGPRSWRYGDATVPECMRGPGGVPGPLHVPLGSGPAERPYRLAVLSSRIVLATVMSPRAVIV